MNLIAWIVLGGVAGLLASLFIKTNGTQGLLMNIVMGVVGAFVGGYIFNFFGYAGVTGLNFYSLLVATIGAVVFIWLLKFFRQGQ